MRDVEAGGNGKTEEPTWTLIYDKVSFVSENGKQLYFYAKTQKKAPPPRVNIGFSSHFAGEIIANERPFC